MRSADLHLITIALNGGQACPVIIAVFMAFLRMLRDAAAFKRQSAYVSRSMLYVKEPCSKIDPQSMSQVAWLHV